MRKVVVLAVTMGLTVGFLTPASAGSVIGEDAIAWQAELVKDINPGAGSGLKDIYISPSSRVFLVGEDGTHGTELWKTDGSAAGTVLVKDINPGSEGALASYGFYSFAELGSTLFFGADDAIHDDEPWTSDGTQAGTALLKDIRADSYSSPGVFTEHNGMVFFSANDRTHGEELWKTDGTEAGTVLVKNINTYRESWMTDYDYGSKPGSLLSFGPYLYFTADDHTNGRELWRTDGTTGGTILLKAIDTTTDPYESGSGYRQFVTDLAPVGPLLFTVAHGTVLELWKTNGSPAGTELVYTFPRYVGYGSAQYLYFRAAIGNVIYFFADDGSHGEELWRTDGTSAGTSMVTDLNPTGSVYPYGWGGPVARIGSDLYFVADDGNCGYHPDGSYTVCELWKSNGTAAGTVKVTNFGSGPEWIPGPYNPVAIGNTLLFYRDAELWKIATPGATPVFVYDFSNPGGDPGGLGPSTDVWPDTVVGDKLIMRRSLPMPTGTTPFDIYQELWLTDGTPAGTRRVFESNDTWAAEIYPRSLKEVVVGNTVFFQGDGRASDPSAGLGMELYRLVVPTGNPPPTVFLGSDATIDEGQAFARPGSFRDWGTDSWTGTVDYGDGSPTETLTLSGNTFALSHTFDDDGSFTLQVCIAGGDGGSGCSSISLVVGNVAPTGTFTASTPVDEGSDITLALTEASDPSATDTAAGFTYAFDCGDGSGYGVFAASNSAACTTDDDEARTVSGKVRDKDGAETEYTASVTVANVPPEVGPITAPTFPLQVGGAITASADFSDQGVADTHSAVWHWGDGSSSAGTVTETSGSGSVTDSHTYAAAGVYEVALTVNDDDGGAGSSTFQYVVVYDPDAGFVTGAGMIDSWPGAYQPDPTLAGAATFGFVSRYQKGATTPTGHTEFRFHTADVRFESSTYQWLVVTGGDYARFKGTGAINGTGEYMFMIWAGDGEPDTFRIKIWSEDELGVESVIYDNGMDQAIGGGSIVIHTKK